MKVVTVPFAELSKRQLIRVAREQAETLSAIQKTPSNPKGPNVKLALAQARAVIEELCKRLEA